jgi:hypothetical protein
MEHDVGVTLGVWEGGGLRAETAVLRGCRRTLVGQASHAELVDLRCEASDAQVFQPGFRRQCLSAQRGDVSPGGREPRSGGHGSLSSVLPAQLGFEHGHGLGEGFLLAAG